MNLFTKFALGIGATVVLFGLVNAIIVRSSVERSLNQEFEKRGYFIARALSEQAVPYLLSNDMAGLNTLVNAMKAIDPTVYYAIVSSEDGRVMAHSFSQSVPQGLLHLNPPGADGSPGIISIRDPARKHLLIRDFSMPVITPALGIVRVGLLEDDITRDVRQTLLRLWAMVGVFFILGISGALFFSYTIATPLKTLSRYSETIDIGNISKVREYIRDSRKLLYYRLRRIFGYRDEIDMLYDYILEMLERLEQTHQAINRLQQSLLQTEKMAAIGTMIAGIAHEINNPLAGFGLGLKRIVRDPENTEQVREYAQMMQETLGRMEQVVKDLLTYSRKSTIEWQADDLNGMIQKAIKLAGYRKGTLPIEFVCDPGKASFKVRVAENRMEQVFLNIIINAMDAIEQRQENEAGLKGRIVIETNADNHMAVVAISDNGSGMTEDVIRRIFDPFFTTKGTGRGTGLGLAVAYQIVIDHGGSIEAASEPGKGSRFVVSLPLWKESET